MVQNLESIGFSVVPFGQGIKHMSLPTKELMKLALETKLILGGHPVLRLMMDNIYIRQDPVENIKVDKQSSAKNRRNHRHHHGSGPSHPLWQRHLRVGLWLARVATLIIGFK